MTAARLHPTGPLLRFGVLVSAIYAAEVLVVQSSLISRHPALAVGAVTFDLMVLVPALFYVLVVRTKRLPWISIVPVLLGSVLGASLVLPAEHETVPNLMSHLLIPAELLFIGYVGVRLYRAFARADARVDVVERVRSALHDLIPIPAVASVAAHELAVLYYAILSWRSRPDAREGELAFSYHQKNGYVGLLAALALIAVVEMTAVHLLVRHWSSMLAWVLTAISIYGVVWVLAHLQAVRLRPILLTSDSLHVRIGLLWGVRVPYDRIARVTVAGRDAPQRGAKGYLHAVTVGAPQLLLELRDPVDVDGLYGYTKRGVRQIGIAVDQRDRFAAELVARTQAAS
jgi:hypothetical protein